MRPTTIFFDYGGTLAYMDPPVEQIWLRLLKELGRDADPAVLGQALQEANEGAGHLNIFDYCGRIQEYWYRYDSVVLKRLGIPDPQGMHSAAIHAGFNRSDWYHLYSDVRETVVALRSGGYRLGIISNNVDEIITRLEQLDLKPYFETLTYSQEARADKPDPAIFRLALDRAGCAPEEAVHVGDSYEADVLGARSVGMIPILIDRNGQLQHADCLCVPDLRRVSELMRTLAEDSARSKPSGSRRGGS